jgi:hypothetical protein
VALALLALAFRAQGVLERADRAVRANERGWRQAGSPVSSATARTSRSVIRASTLGPTDRANDRPRHRHPRPPPTNTTTRENQRDNDTDRYELSAQSGQSHGRPNEQVGLEAHPASRPIVVTRDVYAM